MYKSLAYANMYASAVCSGKVTPGGKKIEEKAGGGIDMTRMQYVHKGMYNGRTTLEKSLEKVKRPRKN